uniref:putative nuclease HARBI1 n=1 Tax=Pristiophorus japonicus TaxID=55135 RepID=UPI00398EC0C7
MSEEQCIRRLRFHKEVVTVLCKLLQTYLAVDTGTRTSLSEALKVTVALNFYATGSFQSPVGDICNTSQFAEHCCIRQVTDALYSKQMNYFKFSMSREDQDERTHGFARIAGFPTVQGATHCTHVALRALPHNYEVFWNRKGFHSLNVQLVCDHRQMILTVNARYPGSCHDAFILREITVSRLFKPLHEGHGWLLGGKVYGVASRLMTSLRNPTNPAEQHDNTSHTTTRAIVEQTIAVLKQRFRCLDHSGGPLQYSSDRVSTITIVSCILHNLAIMRGQPLTPGMDVPPQEEDDEEEAEEPQPRRRQRDTAVAGRAARQRLIAHRFQ